MMITFSTYIWLIYGGVRDLRQSEIAPRLLTRYTNELDIVILPKIFNRNHRGIKDNHQQTDSKNVIKFIRVDKNGLHESNIFVLMACLFQLSLSFDS